MRFLMFDSITGFEKNRMICGYKRISQESGMVEAVGGEFHYPPTLAFESLAQIGGWLISASLDFSVMVVLAMMTKAEALKPIRSGDALSLRVDVLTINRDENNAVVRGEIWREDQCVVRIERIAYGIFKLDDPQLIREQGRFFNAIFLKRTMADEQ